MGESGLTTVQAVHLEARARERHEVAPDAAAEIEHASRTTQPQKVDRLHDLRVQRQPLGPVRVVAPVPIPGMIRGCGLKVGICHDGFFAFR
jgi:hypothetical protein